MKNNFRTKELAGEEFKDSGDTIIPEALANKVVRKTSEQKAWSELGNESSGNNTYDIESTAWAAAWKEYNEERDRQDKIVEAAIRNNDDPNENAIIYLTESPEF